MKKLYKIASGQENIGDEMKKTIEKMKKNFPPRKTLTYRRKRLKYIHQLYETDSQNDNLLTSMKNDDHSYFKMR